LKPFRTAALLIIVGCPVVTLWLKPGLVRFGQFSAGEFVQLLTPLVLVALFIERALEVFLTPWRAKGSAIISTAVKSHAARVAAKEGAAQPALEKAQTDLMQYKSETQKIAFLASLALGIVIASLGVRGLELFVDPAVFAQLSPYQRGAFQAADVLLTGALLGGGSDALHKLVSVFTNFMETTAKKAKGE